MRKTKWLPVVMFFCSLTFFTATVAAEDGGRFDFRAAGAYSLTPTDLQDINNRWGFDLGAGASNIEEKFMALAEFFFVGTFHQEESMYFFGGRIAVGPCLEDVAPMFESNILFSLSLFAMSVTSNHEVAWNPQIGVDIRALSILYFRTVFTGIVGSEMGYAGIFSAGLNFGTPRE